MVLGVRRQSEDCNSTARRNAECTSEPNPQGIAFIIGRTQACNLEIHCAIAPRCIARLVLLSLAALARAFSTYNIHLLTKMTSCFFCRVSIPMSTNICEADKINFEYIIYFSFNVYNIYMYEVVSSGLRRLEVLSDLNLLRKKKPAKIIQLHPSIS